MQHKVQGSSLIIVSLMVAFILTALGVHAAKLQQYHSFGFISADDQKHKKAIEENKITELPK